MDSNRVLEYLNANDYFLVAGHIDPDGDTIASILLMGRLLTHLGKKYKLVIKDRIPGKFNFLEGIGNIKQEVGKFNSHSLITIDAPNLKRVDLLKPRAKVVNIDHHLSNERFGDINWLETNRSAACMMIYELILKAGIKVDKAMGEMVFTGLFTETGGFVLPNVSSEVFKVCAEVISLGVDSSDIALRMTSRDQRNLALLAEILSTLNVDDGIATIELTEDMLDKVGLNHGEHDSDSFIRYPSSIPGIKVAIFFREMLEQGAVRMSFRSLGGVDVNLLASRFGGGGHPAASGAKIKGDFRTEKNRVISETKKFLQSLET
jgi:bifunctional oligoribonuclease and PAP phosphatase NrnA